MVTVEEMYVERSQIDISDAESFDSVVSEDSCLLFCLVIILH